MNAETKTQILDNAERAIEEGFGVRMILSAVFSEGYGYGLRQGHYDGAIVRGNQ